jgi:DNA-binding transcriptional MerR regulator
VRIGAVAEGAGVSVRALRYYEEQHLLDSERSHSGQRHYPDGAVERVKFIQLLYAAGLSSKSIRQLLPCVYTGVASPPMLEHLAQERERMERRITAMTAARDRMDALITAAALTRTEPCAPMAAQPESTDAITGSPAAMPLGTASID